MKKRRRSFFPWGKKEGKEGGTEEDDGEGDEKGKGDIVPGVKNWERIVPMEELESLVAVSKHL